MSAVQTFRGDAVAIAQSDTWAVTGDDSTSLYKFTINGKVVSTPGSGLGDASTAMNWYTALSGSQIPEFLESSWSVGTGSMSATLSRTAINPGNWCPLASAVTGGATVSVSGGAGTVSALTTVTPNSGPNDWGVAGNWVSGSVPGNGDTINLTNSSSSLWYNLDQHGVSTVTLNADNTYTGNIGLPQVNVQGGYYEYRPTNLKFNGIAANLGDGAGTGSGSGFIALDSHTTAFTCNVFSAGSPAFPGLPAVLIRGGAATGNSLNTLQGNVGVAFYSSDTCSLTTLTIGYITNAQSDAVVTCGGGCLLTGAAITQNGGVLQVATSLASLTMDVNAGTATILGSASVTTALDVEGGTLYWESNGGWTAATIGFNGVMDFSRDPRGRTSVNITINNPSGFIDPNKTVTFVNPGGYWPNGIGSGSNLGTNFHLQRS